MICKCGKEIDVDNNLITSSDWDDAYYCFECGRSVLVDRDYGGKVDVVWFEHEGVNKNES